MSLTALWALCLLSSCASVAPSGVEERSAGPRYGIIIDAGTTGTRVHIYALDGRDEEGVPRVQAAPWPRGQGEPLWEMRVEPGLIDSGGNPEAAIASIEPLIAYAADRVGPDERELRRTPLFLMATAGMRALPEQEREAILGPVRAWLRASSPFHVKDVRVITGEEEALFGWLTINYAGGTLNARGTQETLGVLDMGGGSTQIAFAPTKAPEAHGVSVDFGPSALQLYARSYLGYGEERMLERVADPRCSPRGAPLEGGRVGQGDYAACRAVILKALEGPCDKGPCSLMGAWQPPLRGDFVAVSAYFYTMTFAEAGDPASLEALERFGVHYCASEWSEILKAHPEVDPRYLVQYCFSAAYMVSILHEGYGFDMETTQIRALDRIGGNDTGWTLGAMIFEASAL